MSSPIFLTLNQHQQACICKANWLLLWCSRAANAKDLHGLLNPELSSFQAIFGAYNVHLTGVPVSSQVMWCTLH